MGRIGDELSRALENRRRREAQQRAEREKDGGQTRSTPDAHHAGYTALMRSHDRVHTRHVAGKGGGGGA